ncbi:hypothetical protein PRIPAC_80933 [Pristionchus pacificus]|uniref:Uncharacterized protein n=1 Tax=Pristionchus pacificus TaxID=54126 RepID=A0A2A6CQ91_PRIPA|nr:hypothetical protein PRIPAC_80933 [Pristionchus pacificus]|eukprot:PDM80309.1 hypothetical protein PRIPAC_32888 [Pristionchus pacificus]
MGTCALFCIRQLSRGGQELARLFRAIVLVTTMFDLGGWAITQGSAAMLIAIDMADDERFCYETAARIAVNFGVAVKFIVCYSTRCFNKHFGSDLKRDQFQFNSIQFNFYSVACMVSR